MKVARHEEGITAVLVAVSMVGLMAALMLSVDAGNTWQTRRQIITATDATALEQAMVASKLGTSAACTSWTGKLTTNGGSDVQPITCSITSLQPQNGYITVDARKPVAVRFGGIFGIGDSTAYSMSAARWQFASEVVGVRPISFCLGNHHVQEWLAHENLGTPLPAPGGADHPSYAGAGLVHHMSYNKTGTDGACGASPGNWGWLDFNGGSNGVPELSDWLLNGYSENGVSVGDCNGDNASLLEPCPGDTGDKASLKATLDQMIGKTFPVVVYDSLTGNGSNAQFHVYGFLGIILRGFDINGAQGSHYMDMEFTNLDITPGSKCCTTFVPGTDLGARVVRICSNDHDPHLIATRCL